MGETRLARMWHAAPADQSRGGRRMVRRAERPLAHEPMPCGEQARHAPYRGDLDRLLEGEGWQDAPEPAREHRLARARRAQHQQIRTNFAPQGYVMVLPKP